jgi:hypothetical protein
MMIQKRELSLAAAAAAFVMMAGSSAALATIEASMCVNYNDPDELVITTDGDPGKKVKVSKAGDTLTKDKFRGSAGDFGFTGSSHTVKPWSPTGPWKPGSYSFKGKDADGVEMTTTATLSECVADAPEVTAIDGTDVEDINDLEDADGKFCIDGTSGDLDVEWDEVDDPSCGDIDHYVVTVDCDGSPPFSERVETDGDELDSGSFTLNVREKFWGGDEKECTVKVTAVMEDCNTIMSEPVTFITCELPPV